MPSNASVAAGDVDTPEALRDSDVRGEIALPFFPGRPVGTQRGDVAAQVVGDLQRFFRGQLRSGPMRALSLFHRSPVATGIGDEVFFPHAASIPYTAANAFAINS